ncbi:SpvB/TcaC N-terminal domain-containing protein [Methylocystis sp.]|uniref:SpvB/TcaC N-terminal domain-containing protein n=1 Tax=Methylocystis sp. TaxID=1911079 RepID=UPI0025D7E61D|nr:SpvB/TcaC N-terminal domain-containing protein [Methylocystis sp.]
MGSAYSRQIDTAKKIVAGVLVAALNVVSTGIAFAQSTPADASVSDSQITAPAETPDTAPEVPQLPTTELETTPAAANPATIDVPAEAGSVIDAAAAPATTEPDSTIKEPDSENPPEEFSTQSAIGDTTINSSAAVTPLPSLEKLRPNLNDGSLSIPYNLIIPPGRNGLQPYLSLVYNSQNSERRNQLGFGWSLSIPYIKRLNKTGIDQLYGTTTFYSSVDGELVQVGTSTSYRPRIDNGGYHVYQFASSTHWQMTDKSGTTYTYGQNAQARYENPSDTSKKYQWMLETAYDRNNNFISYTYTKDNNELYPSNINYTGASSTTGIFDVAFTTESRPDPEVSYEAGYLIKTQYRIKEVSASVSSNWRRKYALAYANGDNGNRSLLSSVTESGRDPSGNIVTKPSTQFSYTHATKTWTDATSQWAYPEAFFAIAGVGGDLGVRTLDVNGDGLTDILRSHTYPNGCGGTCYFNKVYLNNGSSFVLDSSISVPEYVTSFQTSQGVVFLDANRDGLPDLVRAWSNGVQDIQKLYLATTTGTSTLTWVNQASSSVPFIIDNGYDNGVRFGDVNGDGLPDAVRSWSDGVNPASQTIYLNTGDGWAATTTPAIPETFSVFNKDKGVRLVDVNGDGLVDLVRAYSDSSGTVQKVYINQGNLAWTYDASYSAPFVVSADGYSRGIAISDVNADRLPDVMRSDNNGTPITETYTTQSYGTTWPAASTSPAYPESFLYNGVISGLQLTDLNGDGLDDFSRSQQVTGESSTSTTYIRNGGSSDLLTTITLPTGGTVSYAYQSSGTIKDGLGNRLDPLPTSYDVVQSVTMNNGLGTISSSTYSYVGGANWWGSPIDRRFAGFGTVTETNPDNIITSYFHQGNTSTSTIGEYNDSYAKIGMPFRIVTTDLSGNKYKITITKRDEASTTLGASFPFLAQTIDLTYDGGGTHRDRAVSFTYSTSTGNLTEQKDWGEVTASTDGTFTDTGTDIRTTTITYASSASSSVKIAPSDEVTVDQSGTKVKQTRRYYDNLSLGSVSLGNETKTEEWKNGTSYASTTRAYNSYGLVTQSKDGRGNATSYTYDSYNLFVATSTNALSQPTAYIYDYASGKVATTTDPNGLVTAMVYDGVGRPVLLKQPDLTTPSTLVTKSSFTYIDNTLPSSVRRTDYLNSATTTDTYQYLDGLGRLIQERKTAEVSNTFIARDTTYGQNGLVASESLPYFSSSSSYTSPTTTTQLFTTYVYDALRRPTNTTNAVGSMTNAYSPWKVTTTDPRGKQKEFFRDAFDNLVQVNEKNGGDTYSTYYAYDAINNLTKITDALGNIRNFTYDGLSRRLTAQDLHASADGTFGTYTYAYDDAGNMTQQVDPKSQTVNWTYDALNRPLTEDYTGRSGTEILYKYDSCTQGKGRLCAATSTDTVVNYSYNPLGLVESEKENISGTTYVLTHTYDRQGNVTNIMYPDLSEVTYIYNTAGLLEAVQQKENGGNVVNMVSDFDYGPTRQVTYKAFQNGSASTYTYDPAKLYRLSSIVTTKGSANLQNVSYTYDANGNITQLTDYSSNGLGKTVAYTYDDLNRLITASTTVASSTPYFRTYAYSSIGNITSSTDMGTYTYAETNYSNPHAPTTINGTTYSYDNNGNLISKGSTGYAWDYRNRLLEAAAGNATSSYAYDHSNQRSRMSVGALSTYYPNKYFSITSTGTTTKYVFTPSGDMVGTITGGGALLLAPQTLYSDSLQTGWSDWSYNATRDFASTAHVYSGTYAIGVTYTSAYGGLFLNHAGYNTTGSTHLGFQFYSGAVPPGEVIVKMHDTANAELGTVNLSDYTGSFSANTWYDVAVPLTDIHASAAATTSRGFTFISDTATTVSYDNIRFLKIIATSTTGTLYSEGLGSGWSDWSYNTSNHFTSTSTVATGLYAAKVAYTAAYGGLFLNHAGFNTAGSTHLAFQFYSGTTSPTQLIIKMHDTANNSLGEVNLTTYTGALAPSTWYDVRIPLTDINSAATATTSRGFTFISNTITTAYFDNIRFVSSSTPSSYSQATTSASYIHSDHLGSANMVTNASGDVVQTLDYYPYGTKRIESGEDVSDREFIGERFDESSNLSYLNARYYEGSRGQFLSQDPVFWEIGQSANGKSALYNPQSMNAARTMGGLNSTNASGWNGNTRSRGSSISQAEYLADPQMQNSYAYARGNPITMKDPEGLWGFFFQGDLSGAAGLGSGFAGQGSVGGGFVTDRNPFTDTTDISGYTSYGGLVGGAFHSTTLEGSRSGPNPYTVLGLSGGLSGGVTLTNATRMSQLAGTGVTNTLSLGIGSISWSVSKSGVWTITAALGLEPAISFSVYPTNTNTATVKTFEAKDSSSKDSKTKK